MMFRRLPGVVDARQWDGSTAGAAAIVAWGGCLYGIASATRIRRHAERPSSLFVDLARATAFAEPGDWIVKDPRTDLLDVVPDEAFRRDFETVGD